MARWLDSKKDVWRDRLRSEGGRFIQAWVSEPFARLYGITRDARWLDFCGLVREAMGDCDVYCHAHGYMSTLRIADGRAGYWRQWLEREA